MGNNESANIDSSELDFQKKAINSWTNKDVQSWIKYSETFANLSKKDIKILTTSINSQGIVGNTLSTLSEQDLKEELKLPLGTRRCFIQAIEKLLKNNKYNENTNEIDSKTTEIEGNIESLNNNTTIIDTQNTNDFINKKHLTSEENKTIESEFDITQTQPELNKNQTSMSSQIGYQNSLPPNQISNIQPIYNNQPSMSYNNVISTNHRTGLQYGMYNHQNQISNNNNNNNMANSVPNMSLHTQIQSGGMSVGPQQFVTQDDDDDSENEYQRVSLEHLGMNNNNNNNNANVNNLNNFNNGNLNQSLNNNDDGYDEIPDFNQTYDTVPDLTTNIKTNNNNINQTFIMDEYNDQNDDGYDDIPDLDLISQKQNNQQHQYTMNNHNLKSNTQYISEQKSYSTKPMMDMQSKLIKSVKSHESYSNQSIKQDNEYLIKSISNNLSFKETEIREFARNLWKHLSTIQVKTIRDNKNEPISGFSGVALVKHIKKHFKTNEKDSEIIKKCQQLIEYKYIKLIATLNNQYSNSNSNRNHYFEISNNYLYQFVGEKHRSFIIDDQPDRRAWNVGTKVKIFSKTFSKWVNAKTCEVNGDTVTVEYGPQDKLMKKSLDRYSDDFIRSTNEFKRNRLKLKISDKIEVFINNKWIPGIITDIKNVEKISTNIENLQNIKLKRYIDQFQFNTMNCFDVFEIQIKLDNNKNEKIYYNRWSSNIKVYNNNNISSSNNNISNNYSNNLNKYKFKNGTKIKVYSKTQQKWINGKVIDDSFIDENVVKVRYGDYEKLVPTTPDQLQLLN